MAYMDIPKDVEKIKTKIALGLTKRQLIGFGLAALFGFPTYFFIRKIGLPEEIAMILLVIVALPFIMFAIYEKDGLPAEEILRSYLVYHVLKPKGRKYKVTKANKEIRRKEFSGR